MVDGGNRRSKLPLLPLVPLVSHVVRTIYNMESRLRIMGGVAGVVVRSIAEVSSVMKRTDCSHRLLLGVACSRSRRVIDADHAELGGYRFEIGAWRISEGRES